jgi:hypothetical protein
VRKTQKIQTLYFNIQITAKKVHGKIHSLTIQSPSPIRNGDREVSLRHVEKMKNYRNNPFYIEIIVSMTTLFASN